jgi:O-antigen/teichoic acid export membrane protein
MLALWLLNFGNRLFILQLSDVSEVGLYSLGSRVASAILLLLTAFRAAWPAFAYSIDDDDEAKRSYAYVLTYLLLVASWAALALGLLSPWIVRFLATPEFYESSEVVAPLAFAAVAFGGFIVVSIGLGRTKRTQFNWVVTGAAAAVSVALNLLLIPDYGMMGAAISSVVAFTVMFVGITWWSQRVFPVPYQWRRVVTVVGCAVVLTIVGKALGVPLAVAIGLVAVYPLCLWPLRFYLPAELGWIKQRVARTAP